MRSLFGILDHIIDQAPDAQQATATLNDLNAIVRIAEKMDMEIDSDQAICIQQSGLEWLKHYSQGANWDQCREKAQLTLDN
ncbi:hypothetical protein ACBP46_09355 [Paenalcaligenes hominis]|uniref:hypothetical protein n=1 Tax=Paenalcaligenes hominis TaxID=643674 RepID=UPI003523D117